MTVANDPCRCDCIRWTKGNLWWQYLHFLYALRLVYLLGWPGRRLRRPQRLQQNRWLRTRAVQMIKMWWPPDHLCCQRRCWQRIFSSCGSSDAWKPIIMMMRNSIKVFRSASRSMDWQKTTSRLLCYHREVFEIGNSIFSCLSFSLSLLTEPFDSRTRHLLCERNQCDEFTILHLGFLEYAHYIVTVRFYDLEEFHHRYNIKGLTFYIKTYNPGKWPVRLIKESNRRLLNRISFSSDFTQIEIWFRFIFLFFSFIVTVSILADFATREYRITQ